jgi:hypothetical protein
MLHCNSAYERLVIVHEVKGCLLLNGNLIWDDVFCSRVLRLHRLIVTLGYRIVYILAVCPCEGVDDQIRPDQDI